MGEEFPGLRWGVEKRLEFIEFRLFWEGGINRADITKYFGVSVPQASNDLTQYQELAPHNVRYDKSEKRYFASNSFKSLFLRPDADRYLTQLRSICDGVLPAEETWLTETPPFEALTMPRRLVDANVLRAVLHAIRNKKSLEIHYQSLTRAKAIWRWITPHALGFDGLRWHTRAFCHIDHKFKDFLLPRFLGTRQEGEPGADRAEDYIWHEFTAVVLKPNPHLNEDQKRVVALDYGMSDQRLEVKVRLAWLYYFLRRLNLDFEETKHDPRQQQLVLANPDQVRKAHSRANYEIDKPAKRA